VLSGTIGAGDSIVAEQARVTERKQADKAIRTLGRLAARYVPDFAERAPVLTLDIVPTGKPAPSASSMTASRWPRPSSS